MSVRAVSSAEKAGLSSVFRRTGGADSGENSQKTSLDAENRTSRPVSQYIKIGAISNCCNRVTIFPGRPEAKSRAVMAQAMTVRPKRRERSCRSKSLPPLKVSGRKKEKLSGNGGQFSFGFHLGRERSSTRRFWKNSVIRAAASASRMPLST